MLVQLAITVIVIVAVCAILMWFLRNSGVGIPQPIQIAIWAVVAILAILFVVRAAGVGW